MENEGANCYIPSGNGCFLKCNGFVSKEDFSMECFEFMQSYKRRTNTIEIENSIGLTINLLEILYLIQSKHVG